MKEPIMSKASTNSAECIYPWEASGALLAEDATLLGPLFTRPLRGAKAIREFYETSGEVAGPLKVRWHMNKHVETFLIGSQLVGEHNVHSALWLKRDGAGRVREISHAMRPFPLLLPYHRAMKERLAELIPQKRWTIDQSDAFTVDADEDASRTKLAGDVRFFSPILAKPLQGAELVQFALEGVSKVLGPRRLLSEFPGDGVAGTVWEVAFDGHRVRGLTVVVTDQVGLAIKLITCMLPFPVVERFYYKMKTINGERAGPEYFPI
jgi:YD repeat-containing protein